MNTFENQLNDLFEELVPCSGKADTVAGEIVRATERIAYRNWNDGDHIDVGYGKETCNPAARYLIAKCDKAVVQAVIDARGIRDDDLYDVAVEKLEKAVLDFLNKHPELKSTVNTEDMWSYRNPEEDIDDSYADEDEEDW